MRRMNPTRIVDRLREKERVWNSLLCHSSCTLVSYPSISHKGGLVGGVVPMEMGLTSTEMGHCSRFCSWANISMNLIALHYSVTDLILIHIVSIINNH